jgi:DNA repair exonuclease SbcCD ATPase subunit
MTKSVDESVPLPEGASRGSTGLFKRIRGALFEHNDAPGERSLKESSAAPSEKTESEFESVALRGLRENLIRETGPALAEFTLQLAAAEPIVPDAATRLCIALAVLDKKDISVAQLRSDLEAAGVCLERQERSFLDKADARRREQASAVAELESACAALRAETEREIEELRRAIAEKSEALAHALADCDRRLSAARAEEQDLERKERAFRAARERLAQEYRTLAAEIQLVTKEKDHG